MCSAATSPVADTAVVSGASWGVAILDLSSATLRHFLQPELLKPDLVTFSGDGQWVVAVQGKLLHKEVYPHLKDITNLLHVLYVN